MKSGRLLLWGGVVMPVVYVFTLVAAASLTPGFSYGGDPPSNLGRAGAPVALAFNAGLVLTGLMGLAAGAGLWLSLRRMRVHPLLAGLTAVTTALPPLSLAVAGIFPLPHPLHHAFGIGLAGVFAPLLGALSMMGLPQGRGPALLLGALFVILLVLAPVAMGVGGLVTPRTVGYWSLGIGAVMFAATLSLCLSVMERLRRWRR